MLGMYVSDGREKVNQLTNALLGVPCVAPLSDSYPNGANTTSLADGPEQSTRRAMSLSAIDDVAHQFKGGRCGCARPPGFCCRMLTVSPACAFSPYSVSIGCCKVADACTRMRDAIKASNEPEMRAAAQAVCETYREAEAVIMEVLRAMPA